MTTRIMPVQELNISASLDQSNAVQIVRSQIWWNSAYSVRRNLEIVAPPDGLPKYHPITAYISKDAYSQGKLQSDLKDLEVLYLVSTVPDVWLRLPRVIDNVSNYYRIRFLLQSELDEDEASNDYFIYYSNPFRDTVYSLGSPYVYTSSELDWPLEVVYSNSLISYTKPGEHWSAGQSSISDAKASFQFYGPQVRVVMDKGPAFGIIEIQIDSEPWQKIDLYNQTLLESSIVFSTSQLSDGLHQIRIKVLGQKNPASSSTNVKLKSIQFKKHSLAKDLKEEQYSRYNWGGRLLGS
jgi:hypothetical protein